MNVFFQEYFTYTRSERRGVRVLLLLCLVIAFAPFLVSFLFPNEKVDFSEFQEEIIAFDSESYKENTSSVNLFIFDPNEVDKATLVGFGLSEKVANTFINYRSKFGGFRYKEELKKVYGLEEELYATLEPYIQLREVEKDSKIASQKEEIPKQEITLFAFDPNIASKEQLKEIGLSKKAISNILNYRNAGGKFLVKEDLQKMYSLSTKEYNRIIDYVEIAEKIAEKEEFIAENKEPAKENIPTTYEAVKQPKVIIDINKATKEEWQKLHGIGPAFSARIVKFRNALGGFSSTQQVAETYGLPDSTFQKILLDLRPSPIFKKLNINKLDAGELSKHPYLNKRKANAIINYRAQHGMFSSIEDVKKIQALSSTDIQRIAPYLAF